MFFQTPFFLIVFIAVLFDNTLGVFKENGCPLGFILVQSEIAETCSELKYFVVRTLSSPALRSALYSVNRDL